MRIPEGPLRGGLLEAHVLKVAVHHGDGVDVSAATDVSDGEVFRGHHAHVDDVGVGLVGAVGVCSRVILELTVVFDDGDVVVVAGVGDLPGGVVKTFTAQQEDVVVGTCAGQSALGFTVITDLDGPERVGLRRAERGGNTVGGRGDRAAVSNDTLRGDVAQKVEHEDVVVAVLVGVTDGHVPHPKVGKPFADGPVSVAATTVLDDGDVARLTSGCTLVVGLEGVVLLIDDDVNGRIAREFTHFHLLNIGKLVPVCVAALVASYPNVLAFVEVAKAIVVEDGHGMRPVRSDGHVVVAIAVEITNGDVHGVAVGGVGARNRGAGGRCQRSGGAEHHQHRQENTTHSGLREVVLGKHGHHLFRRWPVRI